MSARLNLSIGIGTLAVMLIMSIGNLYFTNQGREQSEQNNKHITILNSTVNDFIDKWDNRIKISNKINNNTQEKISESVTDILNNLSSHRIVTNLSSGKLEQILNKTEVLTGSQYEKLADKRVRNIVGNLSEEHELIFKALNITKTETPNEEKEFGQLLKEFIESNRDNAHESKRPQVK